MPTNRYEEPPPVNRQLAIFDSAPGANLAHAGSRPSYDPSGSQMGNAPQLLNHAATFYQQGKAGAGYRQAQVDLLHEIVEKDPKIAGLLHARKAGLLQRDIAILEYDSTPGAIRAANFIETVFDRLCGGLHQLLYNALDAIAYGDAAFERIWCVTDFPVPAADDGAPDKASRLRSSSWVVPCEYRHFHPRRIAAQDDGQRLLNIKFPSEEEALSAGYLKSQFTNWWIPQRQTCLMFTPYTYYEQHHGYPLMATLFYLWWYKKQMLMLWAQYNNKWTSPTVSIETTGNNPFPMTVEDKANADALLEAFDRETGSRMPPGWSLKLLELGNLGALNTYKAFIDYADDMASNAIVGQTSTSDSGGGGTKAFGEVQERSFLNILSLDARLVESVINEEIRLLIMLNMPEQLSRCPRLSINTRSIAEIKVQMDVLKAAAELSLDVPVGYARRVTGIDEPRPGEKTLTLMPANYTPGFAGAKPPSQQTAAKTAAQQTRRNRSKAPQGSAPVRK